MDGCLGFYGMLVVASAVTILKLKSKILIFCQNRHRYIC